MKWGNKYANFFKILNYFRCVEEENMKACIKADFAKVGDDYDLSGLDGELADLDDIAKIYFVKSSYANWDRTGVWDI